MIPLDRMLMAGPGRLNRRGSDVVDRAPSLARERV
jgi:hypothetical protein